MLTDCFVQLLWTSFHISRYIVHPNRQRLNGIPLGRFSPIRHLFFLILVDINKDVRNQMNLPNTWLCTCHPLVSLLLKTLRELSITHTAKIKFQNLALESGLGLPVGTSLHPGPPAQPASLTPIVTGPAHSRLCWAVSLAWAALSLTTPSLSHGVRPSSVSHPSGILQSCVLALFP